MMKYTYKVTVRPERLKPNSPFSGTMMTCGGHEDVHFALKSIFGKYGKGGVGSSYEIVAKKPDGADLLSAKELTVMSDNPNPKTDDKDLAVAPVGPKTESVKLKLGQLKQLIREVGEYESPPPGASPGGPAVSGPVWLGPLKSANDNLKSLNRYTTFSQWYKGEHGRAFSALSRAAKAALKQAKIDGSPAVGPLQDFVTALRDKNDSQYAFDQVVKAASAPAVAGPVGEARVRQLIRQEIIKTRIRRVSEATGGDGRPEVVDADNALHLEVGNEYRVTGMPNAQVFVGWSGDIDTPAEEVTLTFKDAVDGDEWESYYAGSAFAWGSSGDTLEVKETSSESYEDQVQEAAPRGRGPAKGGAVKVGDHVLVVLQQTSGYGPLSRWGTVQSISGETADVLIDAINQRKDPIPPEEQWTMTAYLPGLGLKGKPYEREGNTFAGKRRAGKSYIIDPKAPWTNW